MSLIKYGVQEDDEELVKVAERQHNDGDKDGFKPRQAVKQTKLIYSTRKGLNENATSALFRYSPEG